MKKIFGIIILFSFCLLFSLTKYCDTIKNEQIILHEYLVISYNNSTHNPNYVGETLTKLNLVDHADRKNNFKVDSKAIIKVKPSEYNGSGYDRGHMAPSADWQFTLKVNDETFYMTNMCPLNQKLNRLYWRDLETLVRSEIQDCDSMYVVTGPIYNNVLKYIGKTLKIRVPLKFFKVVLLFNEGKVVSHQSWVFDNSSRKQELMGCFYTLDYVELLTGYKFFPNN